jgi:hypothetical protein
VLVLKGAFLMMNSGVKKEKKEKKKKEKKEKWRRHETDTNTKSSFMLYHVWIVTGTVYTPLRLVSQGVREVPRVYHIQHIHHYGITKNFVANLVSFTRLKFVQNSRRC